MTERTKGLDISHHQKPESLDWFVLAREHAFVFVRATYGTRLDQLFRTHTKNAMNAGMRVGGYHFFRQTQDPVRQTEEFLKELAVAGCDASWLPPVIDIEENKEFDGPMDPKKYIDGCKTMLDAVLSTYGKCVLYVTQADWRRLGNPKWLEDPNVLLWVAHWNVAAPATPLNMPWHFWQHVVSKIPGSSGKIDQNYFNGAVYDLPLIGTRDRVDDADIQTDPVPTVRGEDQPTNADLLAAVYSLKADLAPMQKAIRTMMNEVEAIRTRVFEDYKRDMARLTYRMTSVEGRVTSLEERVAELKKQT
jgi:GH25 family lysozyme M1 (1,4-beta-N-acetylmuramidase)